jgi:voltage-gated potassium channel
VSGDEWATARAGGLSGSLARVHAEARTRFRLDAWFPHLPLAIAVGVLGVLRLLPAVERSLGVSLFSRELSLADASVSGLSVRGLPQVVTGAFLIVMSVGLLLRSRLAWLTTLLTTLASLSIALGTRELADRPILSAFNAALVVALILGHRRFQRTSLAAASLFAVVSISSLLVYAVVGSYELGQSFRPPIEDFVTALYFSVVSMATVGYGDIVPQSTEARLFALSVIVAGISVFATSLSALLTPLVTRRMESALRPRTSTMTRTSHYIIVGDTALARNTFQELRRRDQPVTLILSRPPGEGMFHQADVVVGDASDLDVLRLAGADKAQAVLALGADDSDNAFVILAVKDLPGTPRTVAVVNDAKNLTRVNRVQPDLIFSPEVLGGELLAMALRGERVESQDLLDRLLRFRQ